MPSGVSCLGYVSTADFDRPCKLDELIAILQPELDNPQRILREWASAGAIRHDPEGNGSSILRTAAYVPGEVHEDLQDIYDDRGNVRHGRFIGRKKKELSGEEITAAQIAKAIEPLKDSIASLQRRVHTLEQR